MCFINYYCRRCSKETSHEIENFDENPRRNVAKLNCIKCVEPPFVVEYPQGSKAPTRLSQRVDMNLVCEDFEEHYRH